MSEEEDFSKLPFPERWCHTKFKARQSAFEEAAGKLAKDAATASAPSVQLSNEDLRLCVSDVNAIALEAGISVVSKYLDCVSSNAARTRAIRQTAVKPLAEKGLVAVKPAVKMAATDLLLKFVEVTDPGGVVEDLVSVVMTVKTPKAIAAVVIALEQVFLQFGSPVTNPAPATKLLVPFFSNPDRAVREATSKLAVALCRWTGQAAMLQILDGIKPAQLKPLEAEFAKIDFKSVPPRQTLAQQSGPAGGPAAANDDGGGADDRDPARSANNEPEFDVWESSPAVNIGTLVPSSFFTLVESSKWKERHEALAAFAPKLKKTVRMESSNDTGNVLDLLLHVAAKDANQACAVLAIECLTAIAKGLRRDYTGNAQRTMESVHERYKEKKQSVVDAVDKCLDAVLFDVLQCQLSPLLDVVLDQGMAHKVPVVRIGCTNYLAHALSEATAWLKITDVQRMVPVGIKLLGDPTEPQRNAAACLIAVIGKFAGPAKMEPILSGLDDHKKKRVAACSETVSIKARKAAAAPAATSSARPGAAARSAARPATRQTAAAAPNAATGPNATRSGPSRLGVGQKSPIRKAQDVSMNMTSPVPSRDPQGRPSTNSTPKMTKRTLDSAGITPHRGLDTNRRRYDSPMKRGDSDISIEDAHMKIARLQAELDEERERKSQLEKQLAKVQVEKDSQIKKQRDEIAALKFQFTAQCQQFDQWMSSINSATSEDVNKKLGSLNLNLPASTPAVEPQNGPVSLINPTAPRQANGVRPTGGPRHATNRVLPIATSSSQDTNQVRRPVTTSTTGNADWERAVVMTASLKQRVEQLKQQRQRSPSLTPTNSPLH